MEQKSCGYEGSHFGAPYSDAQCVKGYLWDMDSIEGGLFTSGGDIPCPECNTSEYLHDAAQQLQDGICGSDHNPSIWLGVVNCLFDLNEEGTREGLKALGVVKPIYDDTNAPDGIAEAIFSYGHKPMASHYQPVVRTTARPLFTVITDDRPLTQEPMTFDEAMEATFEDWKNEDAAEEYYNALGNEDE